MKNELQSIVDAVARDLREMYDAEPTDEEREAAENGGDPCDLWDYMQREALDIEYTISSAGDFLGARVAVGLGGPSIYIDTRRGEVEGYWGGDHAAAWIPGEICEELNAIYEDCYSCIR